MQIEKRGDLELVRKLAWILDSCIPIPGTRFRVGLDPILGLIPGLGDAVGAAMSSYLIIMAANMGVSKWTLTRMMLNVVVESIVGLIPFVGDIFDATWKANQKNLAIFEKATISGKETRTDRWFVILVLLCILMVFILAAWGTFTVLSWLSGLGVPYDRFVSSGPESDFE